MDTTKKIKVVQLGLGSIGTSCAKVVLNKNGFELVGAVDVAEDKVGTDLGDLLELNRKLNLEVSADVQKVLAETEPDVVLHTTQSFVDVVFPQLETIIASGTNVVSSTEELLFPQLKYPELTRQLDTLAKKYEVTVLGTGVNPGFVMDTLAITMTSVCTNVKKVTAECYVDASKRRLSLQKKVGAGLTVEEFHNLINAGKLGHIGMKESVALIAYALRWELDTIEESIDPVVAEEDFITPYLKVKKGQVAGIKNVGHGWKDGQEVIALDLRMYVGAQNPHDAITIEGDPPVHLIIKDDIFGDLAAVAMLINFAPIVIAAEPGLKTMADLPIPRAFL
ncbi:dihydrodipicolinate reductase [bacterium]|nr:dihydrodipicolinate reductase [bacterium]